MGYCSLVFACWSSKGLNPIIRVPKTIISSMVYVLYEAQGACDRQNVAELSSSNGEPRDVKIS